MTRQKHHGGKAWQMPFMASRKQQEVTGRDQGRNIPFKECP
jgi:hypothetical protein